MLHKLYDTWYAPKNATLIIAGSVDPGDALSQIKQLFNSMKHKKLPSTVSTEARQGQRNPNAHGSTLRAGDADLSHAGV
jgi:predicted Zn-dependent peptidase